MNPADYITLSRIPVAALTAGLIVHAPPLLLPALIAAIYCEASDVLDGAVARASKRTTPLGAMLDPMADSIARLLIFAAFLAAGWISYWLLALLIVRDVIVAYARIHATQRGMAIGARVSGKIKAVAQGGAIIGILLALILNAPYTDGIIAALSWIAALATLWSLHDYVRHFATPPRE